MSETLTASRDEGFKPILDGAKKGSHWAWELIFRELSAPLTGYFSCMGLKDPGDTAISTLREAASRIADFDGSRSDFRIWVFEFAREVVTDANAGRHRVERSGGRHHFEPVNRDQRLTNVIELLDELGPQHRETIALGIGASMPVEEVARLLGRKARTIEIWQQRGLLAAKSMMQGSGAKLDLEGEDIKVVHPDGRDMADLVLFVDSVRALAVQGPMNPAVEQLTIEAGSRLPAPPSVDGDDERSESRIVGFLRRPAVAMVAVFSILALPGAALASDASAPGDPLYGLDRALELIGIGDGSSHERLQEASVLMGRGDPDAAVVLLAESYEAGIASGDIEGAEMLANAIAEIVGNSSDDAAEKVAEIQEFLEVNQGKDVGLDGKEFGQGVAEIASENSNRGGNAENNGNGPPQEPGQGQGSGQGEGQGSGQGQGQGASGKAKSK